MKRWLARMTLVAGLTSCSGSAVIDDGSGSPTTTPTPTGCADHADCPDGVCVFVTNQCMAACSLGEPCEPGTVCDECATSSCPACRDCVAACVAPF